MLYVYHMERLEAIVEGRVQGVSYRDFVMRAALRLGLSGEAENLADGTVRVVAEGERGILDALVTELAKGPFFAEVTNVASSFTRASGGFKGFSVR